MKTANGKYEIDMVNGAILPKLLRYCLPLALSGMLQLFYNAMDVVVVGRFCGSTALAAVGSNGSFVNLLVNLFIGLSVGTGVVVSRYYGAQDADGIRRAVHTAIPVSFLGGLAVMVIGLLAAEPMLELMDSPPDVLPLAVIYLRIIFIGMPANMVYNFGAAILRAVGDTKRPLYILGFSGLVNVGLNLVFVLYFNMSVAGVAWATIISQLLSSTMVVTCLVRSRSAIRLVPSQMRIDPQVLRRLVRLGLPAGIQGALFSISNVLIQSSINSFGSITMAGHAAAANIDGFIYNAKNSVYQASVTIAGQNAGAKRYDRLPRICITCILTVTVIGLSLGILSYIFGEQLLSIYDSNPEVIAVGMVRLFVFGFTYFLLGISDVFVGCMRGMGASILPMIVSLLGVCAFRVFWIYTVFANHRTLLTLYTSYPVSWILTGTVQGICFVWLYRKLRRTPQTEA